jgi:hypothetical protein
MHSIDIIIKKIEDNIDFFDLTDEEYNFVQKIIKKIKKMLRDEYLYGGISQSDKDKFQLYMDRLYELTGINDLC